VGLPGVCSAKAGFSWRIRGSRELLVLPPRPSRSFRLVSLLIVPASFRIFVACYELRPFITIHGPAPVLLSVMNRNGRLGAPCGNWQKITASAYHSRSRSGSDSPRQGR